MRYVCFVCAALVERRALVLDGVTQRCPRCAAGRATILAQARRAAAAAEERGESP